MEGFPHSRVALGDLNIFVVKALYIGPVLISYDWYSGDAHAVRMQGSMSSPRRVRYIIFALFFAFALGSRANASVAIPA